MAEQSRFLCDINTLVSSATKIKSQAVETLLMSLMESKKKRGPRMEPRETSPELLPRAKNLPLKSILNKAT